MPKMPFIGRRQDLARLQGHLDAVVADGRGRLLSVRGRRQAGKSRLVTEFVERSGLPHLFFTGSRQASVRQDLQRFVADVARESTLPGAGAFSGVTVSDWETALRLVVSALPGGPAIVVLDEAPWLVERDPGLDGTLQKLWDTLLEHLPVLLILIGSDLAMREALTAHQRPLFGRAKEVVVDPFHVADTAAMTGTASAADAIDVQLVTGGYPRLLMEWKRGETLAAFLRRQLADEASGLVAVGERVLAAEFPAQVQARLVLSAIGSGERTFTGIGARSGMRAMSVSRSLRTLRDRKRVVAGDVPVSARRSDETRYRVADPYLRFWLRFIEPSLPDIGRGRPDLAISEVERGWAAYRGRAVEPLVREALERLAPADDRLAGVGRVGGYWTRTNNPEVDLVGVDRHPRTRAVRFVGSIKWKERSPFSRSDLSRLLTHRAQVPGAEDARLTAVSRSGGSADGLDAVFSADDVLGAWR